MFRRHFLPVLAALSAPAQAAAPVPATAATWIPPLFPILQRGGYDYDGMMRALTSTAAHKQVFLSNPSLLTGPGIAGIFQKMTLAWTAYEFSLLPTGGAPGHTRVRLAMTGVLIAEPVVFALNDAMWAKYRIGPTLKLRDREGRISHNNFTRAAWSNLDLSASPQSPAGIYHDFTSQALLKRGAGVRVCQNALAGISARFAVAHGSPHAAVLEEWTANLLPGFIAVPSGAFAVQLAQERGYALYPVAINTGHGNLSQLRADRTCPRRSCQRSAIAVFSAHHPRHSLRNHRDPGTGQAYPWKGSLVSAGGRVRPCSRRH